MTLGYSGENYISKTTRKLSVAFPVAHLDAIERLASDQDVSAASVVRELVAKALEAKK